jgi:hypothetical protein
LQEPLTTPRGFFDRVVVPDIEDLKRNPEDVRLAFHAGTSLHQLRDWVYKAGLVPQLSFSQFCESLYGRCPALSTIRDLASNAKHYPPDPEWAEKMDVGVSAAPTFWGSETALWDVAHWNQTTQMQVIARTEDGQSAWMVPVLLTGYHFWEKEFETNGWWSKSVGKFLRIVGKVWCVGAVIVMLFGYGATWYFHGFGAFVETLPSPFNIANFIATMLALAPGIALIMLGNRIEARRASKESRPPA